MISLRKIEPFDARCGMSRDRYRGFGIWIGRRHASADMWLAREKRILVRFSTAGHKQYFEVSSHRRGDISRVAAEDLEHILQLPLLNWLLDATGDDFE